ncbi:MAG: phage portal protein, partial [bacterium]|nr:phage portal protein [bacterium]
TIDKRRSKKRSYAAGTNSPLFKDWPTTGASADAEHYQVFKALLSRSRYLAKNNDYAKRFLNLLKTNVIGSKGVIVQPNAHYKGKPDKRDNELTAIKWAEFGKKGVCTTCGQYSMLDLQNQILQTVARDGDLLLRHIYGWNENPFGYAVQLIPPELVDHDLNKVDDKTGNSIRLGVEYNKWNRRVAYHCFSQDPNDFLTGSYRYSAKHMRLPAEDITHPYTIDRIGQSRGIPWLTTAGRRLHQLNGYEEAELIAARTGASKMGFFKSKTGDDYTGDDDDDPNNPKQPRTMDATPGVIEELPEGMDFVSWDPDHPSTAFEAFTLSTLRGIASGLNVSYVSLANDLRGVSYSSLRQGALDDRDAWRTIQAWFIESIMSQIYERWVSASMLSGALPFPGHKLAKFKNAIYEARGWQWVDPLKEVTANIKAVQNGMKSLSGIAREQGLNSRNILVENKEDKEFAESNGLILPVFHPKEAQQNEQGTIITQK